MKRKIAVLALAIGAVGVLVGCGKQVDLAALVRSSLAWKSIPEDGGN